MQTVCVLCVVLHEAVTDCPRIIRSQAHSASVMNDTTENKFYPCGKTVLYSHSLHIEHTHTFLAISKGQILNIWKSN